MKEKIIKISLFCIIIALAIIGFCQIASYEVTTTVGQKSTLKALNTSAGTLAQGEKDPNGYSYHINTGIWEAIYGYNSYGIAEYKDFQIYCINPGSPINYKYDLLYDEAVAIIKQIQRSSHTYLNGHADTPHVGEITPPRFVPVETKDLPVAAAYIVSDEPIGSWSEEKQRAIWNLRDETIYDGEDGEYESADDDLIIGDADSHNSGPSIYDKEAQDYAEYDSLIRDKGLNPTDKTNLDDVYTKVNQDTKEYTVGPFNIEYTNGIYGDITFAGISEMKVIGYNSEGEQVRDDIKIEKIILSDLATGIYGSSQTPEYFEPSSDLKVDETQQVYPVSGQDFQVVFKDPNSGLSSDDEDRVASISIKVKFKYMLANGQYTKLQGTKYTIKYKHVDSNHHVGHYHNSDNCDGHGCYQDCTQTGYLSGNQQQWLMAADAIRSIYEQEIEIGKDGKITIDTTMDLGGHVWEDVPSGKENIADGQSGILVGQKDTGDRAIPNVKVTLYTQDGKVAKLLSDPNEKGISDEQIMHRINPTYTDSDGNYLFEGLDAMKKYYVTFEYNGQIYLPTEYLNTEDKQYSSVKQMVNAGLYNTEEWKITSKGTESEDDRTEYNEQFKEIGSSPLNYVSTNSLRSGELVKQGRNYYNETFSQNELMGFVLDEDGNYYRDKDLALIDGFYEIDGGNIVETDELQEGIISERIKEYILENKEYPDDEALEDIYEEIVEDAVRKVSSKSKSKIREELWKKLQFIEDCKIESYTQPQGGKIDLYPVYSKFRINHARNNEVYKTAKQAQNGTYSMKVEVLDGITYRPIYPGQFFVNQGLWRRQEADLALRKDIVYAATRINGKTEVYTYDKRSQMTDEERDELARLRAIYEKDRTNLANYQAYLDYAEQIEGKYYWEIQLRMRDYNNYYASTYTREIYPADYSYRSSNTNNSGKDLELYVTYKITVRNSSTSILSQITEIVDYYDEDYIYMDDLSWIMYKNNSDGDNSEISLSKEDYYNTIDKLSLQGDLKKNAKDTDANDDSIYGSASQQDMEEEYNSVYIRGLDNKKLASGEEAYIYLTFKVKSDNNGPVILDDDNSLKQNYVEINGYTTYYRDGTELPNDQTMSSRDAAGLIDIDSNPGNLCLDDLEGNKYEKNFEDDTDRAKSIKVTLDNSAIRSINGTTWEDERTQTVSNSVIGDGIRQDGEIGIQGITVQLVEKLADGKEYVWQTTTTDASGRYEFKTDKDGNVYIIPGDYFIRFQYGNTDSTVLTNSNGGSNTVSYNGQDFKSTVYQKDVKNNKELAGYNETYYNIQASDAFGSNLSDAKDIWSRREAVNNYSNNNGKGVTNHLAEVLASPYANTINNDLIKELRENTNMTAETGIIVLEGEYNRTKTDGDKGTSNGSDIYLYGNDYNGNYTLNNVDFGLTERPKAQLELSKKVTNVKVTLANGSILFDATKGTSNLQWTAGKTYELNKKMNKNKYEEYYNKNHRYAYRTEVDKLVAGKYDSSHNNGLIQIIMDEELMHGATIRISYDLNITNVGETDYSGQDFYYKAIGASDSNKVTTTADVVLDYVANNLQYREADNNGWTIIKNTEAVSQEGLNNNLTNSVAKYNTIVKTTGLNKKLIPTTGDNSDKSTATVGLVLTQLITPENSADDRTYNNMAEITTISNSVGRRMAYSIQGNQDPTAEVPSEVDSAKAEEVIVLPPFGIGNIIVYITLAIGVLVILTTGIIFIKKKVLKK